MKHCKIKSTFSRRFTKATIIPENRVEPRGRFSWTRKCSNPVARILVAGLVNVPRHFSRVREWMSSNAESMLAHCMPNSVLLLRHRWWIKANRVRPSTRMILRMTIHHVSLDFQCFTTGTCRLSVEYELSFAKWVWFWGNLFQFFWSEYLFWEFVLW